MSEAAPAAAVTVEGMTAAELGFDPGPVAAADAAIALSTNGLPATNPQAIPPSGPQRPDNIPEKFWDAAKGAVNVDALAKSYAELEKGRTSAPAAEPAAEPVVDPAKPADPTKPAAATIEKPKAEEAPVASPLSTAMDAAAAEWASGGVVTEETIAALEKQGIPRPIFDLYIAGVKAQTAALLNTAHTAVGGEANYTAMSAWAASTLTDAELAAYNSGIENPDARETVIQGLYARYKTARPSEGTLVAPSGTPTGPSDVYKDRREVTNDMNDPKYQTDPAFRREVENKMARSQQTGFSMREQTSPFAPPVHRR